MLKQPHHNSVKPLIAKAADILLKSLGYQDDLYASERKDEHKLDTYYAVDNDIINLYLEPEKNTKYLEILGEGPESITTKSLSFLLGDFLFKSSEPLLPGHESHTCRFLIIPPHDEELIRMLTAIHSKIFSVEEHLNADTFKKLSDIFKEFDLNHDEQILSNNLRQNVPDLVELLNPYKGPLAALSRFALLSDNVLCRVDTYVEDGFTFPQLYTLNNEGDRKLKDKLRNQWKEILSEFKPQIKSKYAIECDADVLATIEYINDNLLNERKQVILITGSNSIFKSAEKYKPWGDNGPSFSEKYLRHPQAFLSHQEFFSLSDIDSKDSYDTQMSFNLIDWLTLFFPTELRSAIQRKSMNSRKFLSTIKHTVNDGFRDNFYTTYNTDNFIDPKELIEGWKDQVSSLAKMKYSDGLNLAEERGACSLACILIKLKNSSSWSVEKLRETIINHSITTVGSLYSKTALLIGLWSKVTRKVSKGIPALRFDGEYKIIEQYCSNLVQILLNETKMEISVELLEYLHSQNKKIEETDSSLYHALVVHSLAFMAKGHWSASLTLAKTALKISDSLEQSIRGVRRGREAAYLACIAARRSAIDRSGLETAYLYLNETLKRENEGFPDDIRFTAERLMLDTRSYYFELFCESKAPDIAALSDTVNKLYSLFNKTENERDERVKLWVQRQVLTHFFTLLFIVRDVQSVENIIKEYDINKCVTSYQEILNNSNIHYHKPEDDPYAFLICNISAAIWNADTVSRSTSRDEALKTLKNLVPSLPYDKERFGMLQRCIDSLNVALPH